MALFPRRLFLEITTECNLRCELCKLWKNRDPINKLSLKDKSKFLKEFINWLEKLDESDPNLFNVVLSGGEPFLYHDQVLEIARLCKDHNINCYVNTNGSLIKSNLYEILNCGLTALTISIDSHLKEIHDQLRGMPGLFNHLIKVIKKLKTEQKVKGYPIKICIQSILGNWNINSLSAHISFFKHLGLDGIMFQPIQYPFGLLIPHYWYLSHDKFPHSEDNIRNAIEYLLKEKQNDGFIMNSKEEIELWRYYFKDPEYLPDSINPCRSYEQNMIVDVSGNVKFCFNREFEPKNLIGNILSTSLDELWNGSIALQEKVTMRTCKRACGIMACHIDINLR